MVVVDKKLFILIASDFEWNASYSQFNWDEYGKTLLSVVSSLRVAHIVTVTHTRSTVATLIKSGTTNTELLQSNYKNSCAVVHVKLVDFIFVFYSLLVYAVQISRSVTDGDVPWMHATEVGLWLRWTTCCPGAESCLNITVVITFTKYTNTVVITNFTCLHYFIWPI